MRHKNRKVETKFTVEILRVEVAQDPLSPMTSGSADRVGQGLLEIRREVKISSVLPNLPNLNEGARMQTNVFANCRTTSVRRAKPSQQPSQISLFKGLAYDPRATSCHNLHLIQT